MNKRKSDIFTVTESLTNWFEAGGYTVAPHEKVEGEVNNRFGP